MAYHVLIASNDSSNSPIFDKYLGSANTIDTYWESVGRRISLPIISSITKMADSEDGFVIEKENLVAFKEELIKLEEFWKSSDGDIAVPDNFFNDINDIEDAVNKAITNKLKLMIG